MHLQGVSLQHFRNYTQQTFLFPKQTTMIVGKNAVGKTSIIETIALLSTGESFRAEEVQEMIQFNQDLARIKGKVIDTKTGEAGGQDGSAEEDADDKKAISAEETSLEMVITRGMLDGKAVQSRIYTVNDVRRRKKDFIGKFFTVVFRPEDMRLVEGSPSRRRQFIDTALSVCDRTYAESLKTYEDALKRRNRLLDQIQEGKMPRTVLTYWTNLLIKHGEILQEKRRQFFAFFASVEFPVHFEVHYLPSIMSEARMSEYAEKEIIVGHTMIGPHKDDFDVRLKETNFLPVSTYGSRGQQRLAVLWLKISELEFLKQQTHIQPLLLLDDILSELDEEHRGDVISLLTHGQSIITTTEDKIIEEVQPHVTDLDIIHL
jgi:DNA replication and repair protein RecF